MNSCQNCPSLNESIFCNQDGDEQSTYPQLKRQLNLKKGQSLYNQNFSTSGIYCIMKGNIKVIKTNSHGNETIIRVAGAGDLINDDIIFSNSKSEKSAVALTDSVACYIEKTSFLNLIDNKTIAINLLRKKINTLQNAEDHICSIHQKKVIARLAEFLIEQKNIDGVLEKQLWVINLNINRDELAKIVGTAPETVIRSFSMLRKKGIISGQKTICIKDLKALEKIASDC